MTDRALPARPSAAGRRRLCRVAVASLLALGLAGCDTIVGWFGGGGDPPLPGTRVSVLELAESLEPDPQVALAPVVLPDPIDLPDWPQAGQRPTHNPGHPYLRIPFELAWRADIGTGSGGADRLVTPPVVAGGRVYVNDADGRLTAIDAGSGDRIWQVRIASPIEDSQSLGGGVAYANGRLYATTGFGEILALDPANGGLLWRTVASGPTRAAPTVADGRVYVVTVDNQLQAMDAETGAVLWTHTGILEPASLLGSASPAVGSNVVLAAYSSGELFALRVETGRPAWSDSLSAVRRIGGLATLAAIRGMPVLDDDLAFAISHAGRLVALDMITGNRVWEQSIGGINTPWVAGDYVFVLTNENSVVALTRRTGQIVWASELPRWTDPQDRDGPVIWAGPVLAGGFLILVGSEGDGILLSPETGAVTAQFPLPDGSEIPPIVAGRTLYVLTEDADLLAYR